MQSTLTPKLSSKEDSILFLHVSGAWHKTQKVLKWFSVVDVRGLQVLQVVWGVEDVAIEDGVIGQLLLSATDAFGCI